MNKKVILDSIKKLREISPKRNFEQSFDVSINLSNLNAKKAEDKVDLFVQLPHTRGKKVKICALVGKELESKAKIFDNVVLEDEFLVYQKDKKKVKKLARSCDFFIAQANLMPQIAMAFGKVLGPLGKMPNPKAGCVVPPTAVLEPLLEKLNKLVHLETKNQVILKSVAGLESFDDEKVAENIFSVYDNLIHTLPQGNGNIKSVFIKLTMGPTLEITSDGPIIHEKKVNKEKITKIKQTVKKSSEKSAEKKEKNPTARELVENKNE
jgi:large subunit ribosomal protein L1